MHIFRCYFLNEGDHIQAVEEIEANALGEAIDRAQVMLKARPQHCSVELWEGTKRVYPVGYGNVLPLQRHSIYPRK